MLIFRVEHKREVCKSGKYAKGRESLTGHGPMTACFSGKLPNFGGRGTCPAIALIEHERCAVTASQFKDWVSYSTIKCENKTINCSGDSSKYCSWCPASFARLIMPDAWHVVVYEVDDSKEGIDWRIDENQIVFNPEFATLLAPMPIALVQEHLMSNA